jgi:hypothetical protein
MRLFALLAVLGSLAASPAFAQDPVKVDPKHYKVLYEDAGIRVLRVVYGAHEKSVMHDHPALSGVFAADSHFKFTMADGTVLDREGKKGDAIAAPAEKHRPENVGETTAQAILVEFKGPAPKK